MGAVFTVRKLFTTARQTLLAM